MEFDVLAAAIQKQFERMKGSELFRVDIEKDQMWETYLKSFPVGTNPIYKERTEHDCQCCRSFIRSVGDVVAIKDGKVESIWDVQVGNFYQEVANALSALVKSKPIENKFLHFENQAGTEKTFDMEKDNKIITWKHFFIKIPSNRVVNGQVLGSKLGPVRATKDVLYRSLTEITDYSVDTVLEIIAQGSLYRGEEHKFAIESFRKLKTQFNKLKTDSEKNNFCWLLATNKSEPESVLRIRNTAIGTLLVDLSKDEDLEVAVRKFDSVMAPANYKRPTALVSKRMVEDAKKKIQELGFEDALERRYANIQDITINNILFVDRQARKQMKGDVFDEIANSVTQIPKSLDKVEEIGIEAFITSVLPKAESVEVMVENRHSSNLVSLIAPAHANSKSMFKWPNNFSWSYAGEMADSIKERVKRAGGKVDGDLRCSLSWFNHDDLDLYMIEPGGYRIYFGNKGSQSPNKGVLDVDMNAHHGTTRTPVENICYLDRRFMKEGVYELGVNQFCKRETKDVGFEVEIEFDGTPLTMVYSNPVRDRESITVAKISYTKKDGFRVIQSLPSTQLSKEVWGIPTQTFQKVSTIMLSPNHWDEKTVGNKHYFFMLDKCRNEDKARGFFNEFLSEELNTHRKVLEIIGSKMKTDEAEQQLSGVGFSSTQRNHVLCRVSGKFTRVVKVLF